MQFNYKKNVCFLFNRNKAEKDNSEKSGSKAPPQQTKKTP